MKYYRLDMTTIFDDCDYSLALAFEDGMSDEDIQHECQIAFDTYLCAFSRLIGDPASFSDYSEYERTLDYFIRNTDYKVTPIDEDEFRHFENLGQAEV